MEPKLYNFLNVWDTGEAVVTQIWHLPENEMIKKFEEYKKAVKLKYPANTVAWIQVKK
jgi:hypothetical protein